VQTRVGPSVLAHIGNFSPPTWMPGCFPPIQPSREGTALPGASLIGPRAHHLRASGLLDSAEPDKPCLALMRMNASGVRPLINSVRGLNEATAHSPRLRTGGLVPAHDLRASHPSPAKMGGLVPLWPTKTVRPRRLGSFKRVDRPPQLSCRSFFSFSPTRISHNKSILSSVDRALRSLTTDVSAVKPFAH
jgi:hypothetical protein